MLGKHCLEKPSLYHHIFISIFCVGRYLEHQRPYRFAFTAYKMYKYGVISGPHFPVFGLNTGKYGPEITPFLDTFHAVIGLVEAAL